MPRSKLTRAAAWLGENGQCGGSSVKVEEDGGTGDYSVEKERSWSEHKQEEVEGCSKDEHGIAGAHPGAQNSLARKAAAETELRALRALSPFSGAQGRRRRKEKDVGGEVSSAHDLNKKRSFGQGWPQLALATDAAGSRACCGWHRGMQRFVGAVGDDAGMMMA